VPVSQIAAMNGLDPSHPLLAGTVVKLPSGSPTPPRAAEPAPTPVVPNVAPEPTSTRVDSGTVRSIALEHGVPPALAQAIGWQESGFNNGVTSRTGAHGVMQIEPGTWDWIQGSLAGNSLSANSATDNVRGGVLMLKALLQSTGGNEAEAAAGYYQGLSSVQRNGMYADTQNYVNNVMALSSRFGGG
jgi:soluble lytic murein transglycosylase-like protein